MASAPILELINGLNPYTGINQWLAGFLSGFGPRGGKTAICNLVGGMALSTCTALDNVAESGGILNPPNFESFLFRAPCVISGLRMHSLIWFLFHYTLV